MTETIDYIKVETKSFQQMCKDICDLKQRCRELSEENLFLKNENTELKFSRNVLGVQMTPEDLAIEAAENSYRPYVGDDF